MNAWSRICCAIDLQQGSDLVVAAAASLAGRLEAELTLLHVYDAHAPSPEILLERYEQAAPELERLLAEQQREAARASRAPVRPVLLSGGGAAAAIVRFAGDGAFDLLVVGTHADVGLARVVLGSVASRVVREAPCPVMVVRQTPR